MKLNSKATTQIVFPGGYAVDVFSGSGADVNNPDSTGKINSGPVPKGDYFIVDRPVGGTFGKLKTWIWGKEDWFALFRQDGTPDDFTTIDGVERSLFRLHPGSFTEGCVTVCRPEDFRSIRELLIQSPNGVIPGTETVYYGVLRVE